MLQRCPSAASTAPTNVKMSLMTPVTIIPANATLSENGKLKMPTPVKSISVRSMTQMVSGGISDGAMLPEIYIESLSKDGAGAVVLLLDGTAAKELAEAIADLLK